VAMLIFGSSLLAVILVVGLNHEYVNMPSDTVLPSNMFASWESEGFDRPNME
jgi:hypothetical protein